MLTPEMIAEPRSIPYRCQRPCGNCSKPEAYAAAQSAAAELCAALGAGWEPDVWCNLGWHHSARKGCVEVHPRKNDDAHCTVLFNSKGGQTVVSGDGYNQTVGACLAEVRAKIAGLQSDLDEVSPATARAEGE